MTNDQLQMTNNTKQLYVHFCDLSFND